TTEIYTLSLHDALPIFRESGVDLPDGFEDLHTKQEVIASLGALKRRNPSLRKAVVKINEGFSGEGNAIYRYPDVTVDNKLEENRSEEHMSELQSRSDLV